MIANVHDCIQGSRTRGAGKGNFQAYLSQFQNERVLQATFNTKISQIENTLNSIDGNWVSIKLYKPSANFQVNTKFQFFFRMI